MNGTPEPTSSKRRRENAWFWLPVAAAVLVPTLLVIGVASYFCPSSETRALRNGLFGSSETGCERVIAVNVGGLTTSAARTCLSFVKLDTEVRAALQTIHAAEVGIYRLQSHAHVPDPAAMLAGAVEAMATRGWDRIVDMIDQGNLVGIYLPTRIKAFSKLRCCVMVFHGEELIVASARADLEAILKCAFEKPEVHARLQKLAKQWSL